MAFERTDFTRLLQRRIVEMFWENYTEVDPVWMSLFTEDKTDEPFVEKQSMLGMGDLEEKKENEAFAYDTVSEGWPIIGSVKSFGKATAVSYELYKDSEFRNLFGDFVQQMAENYPRTRDRYFANVFNNGALLTGTKELDGTVPGVKIDPTRGLLYDGKPLFAGVGNGHPALMNQGQTYANYLPLTLTLENLNTVYDMMTIDNAYDEQGNKIVIRPDTLVVPQALRSTAMQVLSTQYMPTSSGVSSTKINPLYKAFDIIVWPHLTDRNGWFLVERRKGLKVLNRQAPTIDVWQDDETKQFKASIYTRYGCYADNWRYVFACNTPQS